MEPDNDSCVRAHAHACSRPTHCAHRVHRQPNRCSQRAIKVLNKEAVVVERYSAATIGPSTSIIMWLWWKYIAQCFTPCKVLVSMPAKQWEWLPRRRHGLKTQLIRVQFDAFRVQIHDGYFLKVSFSPSQFWRSRKACRSLSFVQFFFLTTRCC